MEITATPDNSGERLDKFLSGHYPDLSRSQVQKLIQEGRVQVEQEKKNSSYRLKQGDRVFSPSEQELKEQEAQSFQQQKQAAPEVDIVAETDDYVVVNKPAGLVSHRTPHLKEPALIDFLVEKYPEIKEVGEDEWRPGLLHRLDREVSGLLVAARTPESFRNLKKQFQDRRVKKKYTALVHGRVNQDDGEMDLPIKRSPKGFKMATASDSEEGSKQALSRFWVLERKKKFSLLRVRILTGRTHQIRVHLSAYGHPVVGDDMYGHKKTKVENQRIRERGFLRGRVFLVADVLQFRDLQGETRELTLELPPELLDLWKTLK